MVQDKLQFITKNLDDVECQLAETSYAVTYIKDTLKVMLKECKTVSDYRKNIKRVIGED